MSLNTDVVTMGPTHGSCTPGQALSLGLRWLLGIISLNPESPLHENSVVGLSLVPLANGEYSFGAKRSIDMTFDATTSKTDMIMVMLMRMGQLATSQQTVDRVDVAVGTKLGSQIYLVGRPVIDSTTKTYALQLDLVQVTHVRLQSLSDLRCERISDDVTVATFFRQQLRVVQHSDSKWLAFDVGAQPSALSIDDIEPMLTQSQAVSSLSWVASSYLPD